MSKEYYERELYHLHKLATEFAQAHPSLAPMLAEQSSDPDVERLLEGTAFLSSLISQKLEDDLPEIIHGLINMVFPHYLRPIPSMTMIKFKPKRSLLETVRVPRGARIDSAQVEGVPCSFTTCYDLDLHPLEITGASYNRNLGGRSSVSLEFALQGISLDKWNVGSLRVHLSGPFAQAASRFELLTNNLHAVRVRPSSGGSEITLPASAIQQVGFAEKENLLSYPGNAFPSYRILQEYFILPEKFLFLDITGLERWQDRGTGSGFEIIFELEKQPETDPDISSSHFQLFVCPAINLFSSSAEPILLDHRQSEYRIRPDWGETGQFQVYSVQKVTGIEQGTVQKRQYMPFEMFNPQSKSQPVYSVRTKPSALSNKPEMYLSVAYTGQMETPNVETLSLDIMCTNGDLAQNLEVGDINRPTESSPELAQFANIRIPTSPVQPPLDKNMLWRFLSHLYLNYLSIAEVNSLQEILKIYIFTDTRDRSQVLANTQRVEAIRELHFERSHRIIKGRVLHGQDIVITLDPNGFTGLGDMQLFSSVLDRLLAGYAAINNYTRLIVLDTRKKELFKWPPRLGDRPLL
ncbi:MAG: type VI secretion system baseplate subunit TssF [Desulfohalobiaceae bacterium]